MINETLEAFGKRKYTVTDKVRAANRQRNLGRKPSLEWRHYMSERMSGENNPNWKGGRGQKASGYVRVMLGPGIHILEHRAIWEAAHGPIPDGFLIHHKNGDKSDNRLENLELKSYSDHSKDHFTENPWKVNHKNGE